MKQKQKRKHFYTESISVPNLNVKPSDIVTQRVGIRDGFKIDEKTGSRSGRPPYVWVVGVGRWFKMPSLIAFYRKITKFYKKKPCYVSQ